MERAKIGKSVSYALGMRSQCRREKKSPQRNLSTKLDTLKLALQLAFCSGVKTFN
jgi:hypothetical protein